MRVRTAVLAAAVAAGATGVVVAASVEDDLAVVKRAVASQEVKAADPIVVRDPAPARSGAALKWLKVRVTEKGTKKAKVTINLPIALVRALGDDYPLPIGGRHHWHGDHEREKVIRLGEVLEALEAGSPLVEVDDDDAYVRVWVE